MKSVRIRIVNEMKNHKVLHNMDTPVDRAPLLEITNQLNKSDPGTSNSKTVLYTEIDFEIQCQSTYSIVSEMKSENTSQVKADLDLETILSWDKLEPPLKIVLPNEKSNVCSH